MTANSAFQLKFGSLLASTLGASATSAALLAAAERRSVGRRGVLVDNMTIRTASQSDIGTIAEHFRLMWLEMGWSPETLREDSLDIVASFAERARAESYFTAFVAEVNGDVAGTAACQLLSGLYPEIRRASSHRAGYIWGVYTRPRYRRRGVATGLTTAALDYLKGLGCTRATLHASTFGDRVYRSLGFSGTNELALDLVAPDV